MSECVGKIVAVSELNVQILVDPSKKVELRDILYVDYKGKRYTFEAEEAERSVIHALPFQNIAGPSERVGRMEGR